MKIIADLHIHSSYSRATSSRLTPPSLERWARIKGIGLLGTGDCTHPAWLEELRAAMDDAGEGFYTLKKEVRAAFDAGPAFVEGLPLPGLSEETPYNETPRFVLTGEISTIYKKGNKTRKIHHLVILPDFRAAAAFNIRLESIGGNIRSDGRPILGLDSRDLLALLLEADENAMLIPAHIWTPWFSALGEKSGFDSIGECYGDLAAYIPAVETGLSSNPPMNWALRGLDKYSIISNSDAHSPDKLGREATILDMTLSFASLGAALASSGNSPEGAEKPRFPAVLGTVEFFPQEGKYHYDGHRKCGVSLGPEEAARAEYICPRCGKPLTRGVMGRVLELADTSVNEAEPCPPDFWGGNRRPYHSLIPLKEIASELLGTGPASKKTENAYAALIEKGGSEFSILMDKSREELEKLSVPGLSGEIVAEAVMKMRAGEVFVSPGYDGEYGTVKVFASGYVPEKNAAAGDLFGEAGDSAGRGRTKKVSAPGETRPRGGTKVPENKKSKAAPPAEKREKNFTLDGDQEKAVSYNGKAAIVIAGPGTGKTAVLGARVARLIREGAAPEAILAVTFTVKAAAELRERIARLSGDAGEASPRKAVNAVTFHSFCCSVLREQSARAGLPGDFKILGEEERNSLLLEIGGKRARRLGTYIEGRKRFLLQPGGTFPNFAGGEIPGFPESATPEIPPADGEMEILYGEYRKALKKSFSLDFEDLSAGTVRLFASRPEILKIYRERFTHVFVDEYQDVNFSQYALIRLLAPGGDGPSLWVIGDPNQAIYGFRGSDKRFIDRFLSDYPGAGQFELSKSFRCAGPIIRAAGKLTGSSLRLTAKDDGAPGAAEVSLYRTRYPTEKSEAEGIARTIDALVGGTGFLQADSGAGEKIPSGNGGLAPEDCAVLVRASALAGPIIKALQDHGIPFEFSDGGPWWKKEPAGAFLGMLKEREKTGRETSGSPEDSVRSAWEEFSKMRKIKKKESPEFVEKLIALAGVFGNLSSLFDTLDSCAASGIPEQEPAAGEGLSSVRSGGVKVMTIHAAKGLEFEQVFVAGLEEGILPFTLFDKNDEEKSSGGPEGERIEEERRILYVAMTRARRGLRLSCADTRVFRGRKLKGAPSRFLSELEKIIPLAAPDRASKWDGQLNLF